MNAHSPRGLTRLRNLTRGCIAALLPLVAVSSAAPVAAQQAAKSKKAEVRIGAGEMDGCGAHPSGESGRECLRGRVMTVAGEQRPMRMRDGGAVEGELFSTVKVDYDERGNRVKIDSTRTEPDARMVQEFSYDAAGNWVKRVTSHWLSENGPARPYRVERRHITYY